MFSIGEFAEHGRVSVRMLRHYDATGLLRPARVDPVTGYRFYEAGQLARLNRVVALKDLGFTLRQVGLILDERLDADALRGMLCLRRVELETAVAEAAVRLARVEARLRTIESEGHMPTEDVVVKRIPAVRLAELSGVAAGFSPEDIGPVVGPLFDALCTVLEAAGVEPIGPGIAYYEDSPNGDDGIVVHAGLPVAPSVSGTADFAVVELPVIERAATIVHRGPMDGVLTTAQTLAHRIDTDGYRSTGYARESYLECPQDQAKWVTELQEPITEL
ncbi:MerR family transcriptional regulator [Streptomyces sp. SID3343]|uniref:MerR family transcriptional regulator n=1 Tax=Streptomyces sp. SID3343 TaxID=2690260 RepID=UPI00136FC0AD|nr:MerR family transcriptional regulator [Streptomyces sp. SID3343]MYV98630.1 MerR family transcriptional regulator [Streptomyces sp. SID3343]